MARGALTYAAVGAITMFPALFMEYLVARAIDRLHSEKEHPDSLSEVRVEAISASPIKE